MLIIFFSFCPPKIKSAATEVTAQKTQTPIVAKLTECEMGRKTHNIQSPEFAFLSNSKQLYAAQTKRIYPYKKKNTPNFTQYSVSLAKLV